MGLVCKAHHTVDGVPAAKAHAMALTLANSLMTKGVTCFSDVYWISSCFKLKGGIPQRRNMNPLSVGIVVRIFAGSSRTIDDLFLVVAFHMCDGAFALLWHR